jgi:hypothetical protein
MISAVKDFPDDIPLLFNKGLVHYLNKEYKESVRIYYDLLDKVQSKNNVLTNLYLCHLHLKDYEEILELECRIEKKDDFLDCTEKHLRMMVAVANEKLMMEEPQRHEAYSKIVRDRKTKESWQAKIKQQSASGSPKYNQIYPLE